MMHPLVGLAKASVEQFIRTKIMIPEPDPLPPEMAARAGVFVCIKKYGQLRGCIGTFSPCTDNIAMETIRNAVSAATRDPRFPPLSENELDDVEYSVDVLSMPEKVRSSSELDHREYGVIVASGQKRGLLLPDLEGVDSVDEQLRITRMKAGILPDEPAEIFRFRVERYK